MHNMRTQDQDTAIIGLEELDCTVRMESFLANL